MKKIALIECNLDLLTLSLSYVFYETLVLKSAVNKINRKVCAGACLILAAKLNDVKGTSLSGLIEVNRPKKFIEANFIEFKKAFDLHS